MQCVKWWCLVAAMVLGGVLVFAAMMQEKEQ
jgi:hypothetical protein